MPQAPTISSVTGGNAQAEIAITANNTGGSSITGYTVTSSPGSITASGSSPVTVTGLTNGTAYTFTAVATNANGNSLASSASSSVTPSAWEPIGAYDSIATATPNGSSGTVTFNSIPSTYTHLQLRVFTRFSTGSVGQYDPLKIRFNSDTNSNYSYHYLTGVGSVVNVGAGNTQTQTWGGLAGYGGTNSAFDASITDILDYTNTNKYKTIRTLSGTDNNGSGEAFFVSGLWQSTNAITSITIDTVNTGSTFFTANSSFALYGIKGA